MLRRQVVSSNIHSIGYDPKTRIAHVAFHKDGDVTDVHEYHDVDEADHRALVNADSIGRHFHGVFKKKYASAGKVNP